MSLVIIKSKSTKEKKGARQFTNKKQRENNEISRDEILRAIRMCHIPEKKRKKNTNTHTQFVHHLLVVPSYVYVCKEIEWCMVEHASVILSLMIVH